jgi:hypothetical protein
LLYRDSLEVLLAIELDDVRCARRATWPPPQRPPAAKGTPEAADPVGAHLEDAPDGHLVERLACRRVALLESEDGNPAMWSHLLG